MIKRYKKWLIISVISLAFIGLVILLTLLVNTNTPDTSPNVLSHIIDSIPCKSMEQVSYHIHVHLVILDYGKPVVIPAGIGITKPWDIGPGGFIGGGSCFYWLHTHDATGIIHIESPTKQAFTLGQFFDIWKKPLRKNNVAGYRGALTIYINQKPITANPRGINLVNHENIILEIGKKTLPPKNFNFQAVGL